jgi:hypothetical protein
MHSDLESVTSSFRFWSDLETNNYFAYAIYMYDPPYPP